MDLDSFLLLLIVLTFLIRLGFGVSAPTDVPLIFILHLLERLLDSSLSMRIIILKIFGGIFISLYIFSVMFRILFRKEISMNKPDCLDPVLILNPKSKSFIAHSDFLFVDGHSTYITSQHRFFVLSGEDIHKVLRIRYAKSLIYDPKRYSAKEYEQVQKRLDNYLDNSFLLDSSTKEICPLYIYVPCGKCNVCHSKKLASYTQRCEFALQESRLPAYFVTLTFNDEHLPYAHCKKPLVNWKKRLRRNIGLHLIKCLHDSIEVANAKVRNVKFVAVSEFGKKNKRLHYHCIVFGVPHLGPIHTAQYDDDEYYFRKLCQFCWRDVERDGIHVVTFSEYLMLHPTSTNVKKGEDPYSKGYVNISPAKSSKDCVKYILKYTFKNLEEDKNAFRSISCNLGLAFARKFKDLYLESGRNEFEYMDFLTGKVCKSSFSSYYLKKLFPSDSQILSSDFRKHYFLAYIQALRLAKFDFVPVDYRNLGKAVIAYLHSNYPLVRVFSCSCVEKNPLDNIVMDSEQINKYTAEWCRDTALDCELHLCYIRDFDLEYEDFVKAVSDRCKVLSVFEKSVPRTRGQLLDISNRFVKSIKDYQSREFV